MKAYVSYGKCPDEKIDGKYYQVKFDYSSKSEEEYMKKVMDSLLENYGSRSKMKDYIMPYRSDENGNYSPFGPIVGGTTIPESLLEGFIERFIEIDGIKVCFNEHEYNSFDADIIQKEIDSLRTNINMNQTQRGYALNFSYSNSQQEQETLASVAELLESYGASSIRAKEGFSYITSSLAQKKEESGATSEVVTSMVVPSDLIEPTIERFIECDNMIVNANGRQLKNRFDKKSYEFMVDSLKSGITIDPSRINIDMVQTGEGYFLKFNCSNSTQQRTLFNSVEGLLENYGARSVRSLQGGSSYIKPRLVDKNGETSLDSEICGDMIVPTDLVKPIIEHFVDTGMVVTAGGEQLKDKFDEESFGTMLDKLRTNVDMSLTEKGYSLKFNYTNSEQQRNVYSTIEDLLVTYGANSPRVLEQNGSYIMPTLIDENGQITNDSEVVGEVIVPDDLIQPLVERFVDIDNMIINVGDEQLRDKFDENAYNNILKTLSPSEENMIPQDDVGMEQ